MSSKDEDIKRIANALERMVEQNVAGLDFHARAAAATVRRQEIDEEILGYWRANEERNAAAERRKEADDLIKTLNDSMDRAKMTAQARQWLKLVDDEGSILGDSNT